MIKYKSNKINIEMQYIKLLKKSKKMKIELKYIN
jgi:uncharacterized LabA/DUF88 family protein